jgi:hypothetical protein
LANQPPIAVIQGYGLALINYFSMAKKSKKSDWISTMEFQHKPMHQWENCSYSTFLKKRKKGEEVRSRKAGTGTWKLEY